MRLGGPISPYLASTQVIALNPFILNCLGGQTVRWCYSVWTPCKTSAKQKHDRGRDSQPGPQPRLVSQPQGATKVASRTAETCVRRLETNACLSDVMLNMWVALWHSSWHSLRLEELPLKRCSESFDVQIKLIKDEESLRSHGVRFFQEILEETDSFVELHQEHLTIATLPAWGRIPAKWHCNMSVLLCQSETPHLSWAVRWTDLAKKCRGGILYSRLASLDRVQLQKCLVLACFVGVECSRVWLAQVEIVAYMIYLEGSEYPEMYLEGSEYPEMLYFSLKHSWTPKHGNMLGNSLPDGPAQQTTEDCLKYVGCLQ